MIVTHKLELHLDRWGEAPTFEAVQGDTGRVMEVSLFAGGEAWTVPEGTAVQVRFRKSDGTGGVYNTLPDNTAAYTISGNVVTVRLAPEVTSAAGTVELQVALSGSGQTLAAFTVLLRVQADPSMDAVESKDYFNLRQWIFEELDRKFDEMDDSIFYVHVIQSSTDGIVYASRPYIEIWEAFQAGKQVCCKLELWYDNEPGVLLLPLVRDVDDTLMFQRVVNQRYYFISITSLGEVTYKNGTLLEYSDLPAVVTCTPQTLTGEQKAQARSNIGAAESNESFAGKTASFYGDSLTEANYHYTKGYHAWVKEALGLAAVNNYGVSGYKVSDVYAKVNAVNDAADIIFVMCGVNDQNFSVPLGTFSDRTADTTYGSLHLLCGLLKEKYPTKLVVFITPHYQTKYPHAQGITSYEVSKAIREVCEKYAIPVYDNFTLSGIYSTNLSKFTTDNCHWNDTAHEMVGKNLAKFMVSTFGYIYGNESGEDTTFIGKTVTVEKNLNDGAYAHLVALVAVDDDIANGTVISAALTGTDCVNVTAGSNTGGAVFADDSGDVSNGLYTAQISHGTINHTITAEGNTAAWTVDDRTIDTDVTAPYIKVPFLVAGTVPHSFRISDIAVYANGVKKEIIALGAFFGSDQEVITIS